MDEFKNNILERFDIECGLTILMDSNCGDMEYKQLAHWNDIKSFISKALDEQLSFIKNEKI